MPPAKTMPPSIEDLFGPINDDVTWLHTIWDLYLQLYGTNPKYLDVMNMSAPQFFAILENVLFEELILIVGRLTDAPRTSGHENASIERLIEEIEAENYAALGASLRKRLQDFKTNYPGFKTWRNWRVGHSDKLTVTKGSAFPMPAMPKNHVQAAVDELAAIMNEVSLSLMDSVQAYKPFMVAHGDGNALMEMLERATSAS